MPHAQRSHRSLVVGAALALALGGLACNPLPAQAITHDTEAKLTETQKKVEDSAAAYDKATQNVQKLQDKIDENQRQIDDLQAQLPAKKEKATKALKDIYKYQKGSNPLMSVVLQSKSIDEFITQMTYMNQIQDANLKALEDLDAAQKKLEQHQVELSQAKQKAQQEQQTAQQSLAEAQRLREEAQAKAEAEQAADAAALAQAGAPAATLNNDGANWSTDEATFVAQWAPRIDAYLAGSPLAGQGRTFADAAWKYGVDPRYSPAISNVESSKGAACFKPHNAWGWGGSSWGSWEEAINAHVEGLARGYGYTVSPAAAQKYCPPTWQDWYGKVVAEMNKI